MKVSKICEGESRGESARRTYLKGGPEYAQLDKRHRAAPWGATRERTGAGGESVLGRRAGWYVKEWARVLNREGPKVYRTLSCLVLLVMLI